MSEFLDGSKSDLDIVGITETSEKNDTSFISNVSLPGYTLFHTPTNTRNGGTALYVKSIYNSFERFDLKIQDDMFEGVWTEISNKNSKNILCGCIYRHPRFNLTDFLVYMEFVLKKAATEDKEVYICGDFNDFKAIHRGF